MDCRYIWVESAVELDLIQFIQDDDDEFAAYRKAHCEAVRDYIVYGTSGPISTYFSDEGVAIVSYGRSWLSCSYPKPVADAVHHMLNGEYLNPIYA